MLFIILLPYAKIKTSARVNFLIPKIQIKGLVKPEGCTYFNVKIKQSGQINHLDLKQN